MNVEQELNFFVNYWVSKRGRGAYKRDWNRMFRNRLARRQREIDERKRCSLSEIEELPRRAAQERASQQREAETTEREASKEKDNIEDDGLFN